MMNFVSFWCFDSELDEREMEIVFVIKVAAEILTPI